MQWNRFQIKDSVCKASLLLAFGMKVIKGNVKRCPEYYCCHPVPLYPPTAQSANTNFYTIVLVTLVEQSIIPTVYFVILCKWNFAWNSRFLGELHLAGQHCLSCLWWGSSSLGAHSVGEKQNVACNLGAWGALELDLFHPLSIQNFIPSQSKFVYKEKKGEGDLVYFTVERAC